MFKVSREAKFAATPAQVWAVLADFPNYSTWQRLVRLRGNAGPEERIEYSLDPTGRERFFWLEGRITGWEERRSLAWSVGVKGLLVIDEAFTLRPAGAETKLHHSTAWRGIAALLGSRILKRRIPVVLAAWDKALAKMLREKSTHGSTAGCPRNTRRPKRHGSRAGKRRK